MTSSGLRAPTCFGVEDVTTGDDGADDVDVEDDDEAADEDEGLFRPVSIPNGCCCCCCRPLTLIFKPLSNVALVESKTPLIFELGLGFPPELATAKEPSTFVTLTCGTVLTPPLSLLLGVMTVEDEEAAGEPLLLLLTLTAADPVVVILPNGDLCCLLGDRGLRPLLVPTVVSLLPLCIAPLPKAPTLT